MKKTLLFITLFAGVVSLRAQKANAIFFTENGEKFYVVMNGLRQSQEARTNVKVEGLNPGAYKCRILFVDSSIPALDKTIYPEGGKEYTFVIKKKEESKASKKTKGFTNNIIKNFGSDDTLNTSDKGSWYVIRLLSVVEMAQNAGTQERTQPLQQQQPGVSTQTTTSSTTVEPTSSSSSSSSSSSVSMNVSMSATGVNVNAGETHAESTTVTSSTFTGDHYVLPGYNGAIGCPWPLSDADFRAVKESITTKDFEDSKITVAKQVINNNCLLSRQVRDIMKLFTFEDTRLDLAKYAYQHTYDVNNYYQVNDAFEFESSIGELDEYIHSIR